MSALISLGKKHLHPLVYFVADKPTKKNKNPEIPLVGTDSYKKLLAWIGDMDIDISRVRMFNQSDKPFNNPMAVVSLNQAVWNNHIKVVALGQQASKYLNNIGLDEYFLLPHPSSRNRQLNNIVEVKRKLETCREYIYR